VKLVWLADTNLGQQMKRNNPESCDTSWTLHYSYIIINPESCDTSWTLHYYYIIINPESCDTSWTLHYYYIIIDWYCAEGQHFPDLLFWLE